MSTKDYSHEIVSIDDATMAYIKSRLEAGNALVKSINETGFTPEHIAWIKSFSSVINLLDPLGGDYTHSLASEWYASQWYGGNLPTTFAEYSIVFGQYLAVVQSLLLGKVKIVKTNTKHTFLGESYDISIDQNLVFVLMPFVEKWSDYIWKRQIKRIIEKMDGYNFKCQRADELFGNDILKDIYKSIASASIIIADITNRNANVFYELGLAHTLGKDVILLTQDANDIPFDVNRFRLCIYSNDGEGYEKLEKYIPNAIEDILYKRTH